MSATYLDAILAQHRADATRDDRVLECERAQLTDLDPCRDFGAALRAAAPLAVISEVKRRSPSKGDLFIDLDPAEFAALYETGGAACCSVLTDSEWFGGSASDLASARAAIDLPVLRKDFTVCELDIVDARAMGADCVLLIVAALSDDELIRFHALATDLGLGVLVEVHDEIEAARAVDIGATIIGINQRDLVTFEVDTERAVRVAQALPDDVLKVAESGIGGPDAIPDLVDAGFDAVLVGESLVKSGDPTAAVQALIEAARPPWTPSEAAH